MAIPFFKSSEEANSFAYAAQWIECITGEPVDQAVVRFRCLDEDRNGSLPAWDHRGTLASCFPSLLEQNALGKGVFVQINESKPRGRSNADIIRVRTCCIDVDTKSNTVWDDVETELPPSMLVTGRARDGTGGHAYWVVRDCSLDDFRRTQDGLANRFGSAHDVSDLARIMRLPGFGNRKYGGNFPVEVIYSSDRIYSVKEIWEVAPPPPPTFFGVTTDVTGWPMEARIEQALYWLNTRAPDISSDGRHHHDQRKAVVGTLRCGFAVDDPKALEVLLDHWSCDARPNEHRDLARWSVRQPIPANFGSMLRFDVETVLKQLFKKPQKENTDATDQI